MIDPLKNNALYIEHKELLEEIADCEKALSNDQEFLADAQKNVQKSQVNLAKAIIALDEFKKQHAREMEAIATDPF